MPLKSPVQLSTVAEYKKLIQADVRTLTTTGSKFQYFTKYTFGDKSSSPVFLLGSIDSTLLGTISKNGTGPASGQATINDTDEITLEVMKGTVGYSGLAKALKGWGVTRTLHIPKGSEEKEEEEKSTEETGSPQLKGRPLPTPRTGGVPPKTPPPNVGAQPGAKPPQNPPQARVTPPQGVNPPTAPPQTGSVPPKTSPPNVGPQPGAKPPQNPPQGRPGPQGVKPPTANKPAVVTIKKVFDDRWKNLKPVYDTAMNGKGGAALKPLYDGMLTKARNGDFKGALAEAGKLDVAISKAQFSERKETQQKNRATRLAETFGAVKKSYFTPGSSDRLAEEKLNAGKEFKAFLSAQKAFEQARDEKTLDALEKGALAYCKHFEEDHSAADQKKAENQRKFSICQTALKAARHYRLALEQDKIGPPPWDDEKEVKSAEIYAKLLFEQDDGKLATANSSSGESGSFWLEETTFSDKPTDPNKQEKTFIFKPVDVEAEVPGFPKGGSAGREVMGKVIGDQLQAMMGLDFGVPETSLIDVDDSKLADEHGKPGNGGPRTGSVQHFTKSKGELRDLARKDPSFAASIPEEEVQKMAVLDLIQLNMDRHSGNFMIGDGNGKPRLVPIDHGLVLPSRGGLGARRFKMGPPHNALGDLPAAEKNVSPEMVEKINQIDPDAVVAAMKKAYDAMAKLHPDAAKSAEISEENFKLTKRSILFLKKAAGQLTLAEIQDAYVANLEKIFDTTDDKVEEGFDEAIKSAKARTPVLKELAALTQDWGKTLKQLKGLGWGQDFGSADSFDGWVKMNPEKVVKIIKNNIENPAGRKEVNDLLNQLKDVDAKKLDPGVPGLDQQLAHLRWALKEKKRGQAKSLGLDSAKIDDSLLVDVYDSLGGADKLKQLTPDPGKLGFKEKVGLLAQGEIARLGGVTELAKVKKLYPKSDVDTPARQLTTLRAWLEYQALGGDKAFSQSGASGENLKITSRLEEIKCMKQVEAIA